MAKRRTTMGLYGVYYAPSDGSSMVKDAEWTNLGVTLEGTASLAQEDNEVTEINIEESDAPIVENQSKGKVTFNSSIPDLSPRVLEILLGASTTDVTDDGELQEQTSIPSSAQYIYYMFKFVPMEGAKALLFPKGQVSAKVNGNMSKTETLNVDLIVTALEPDTTDAYFIIRNKKEGTSGYVLGKEMAVTAMDDLIALGNTAKMSYTIDSNSAQTDVSLDFSASVDWDDILSELNTKSNPHGATWSFDEATFRTTLTSSTSGVGSTVAIGVSGTPATDIMTSSFTQMINGTVVNGQ